MTLQQLLLCSVARRSFLSSSWATSPSASSFRLVRVSLVGFVLSACARRVVPDPALVAWTGDPSAFGASSFNKQSPERMGQGANKQLIGPSYWAKEPRIT
ncbi:unnamed protein product [Polarella glacialis]|uniref:Uncharacterized protein n=1 Tax=Polarella glacialis TaxID=89957 RepID=A0A813GCC2_POLGL|nr:unnamed protein product [Polarella glacialis]CAE8682772.1 unnamed protein product [Polarella glacialis]